MVSPIPAWPESDFPIVHGAHSPERLAPRAEMIADELRAVAPARSEADEATIKLAALILARVEIANEWLDENGIFADTRGTPQPVLRVLSTWENSASRLLAQLGMTPLARAELGLHVARARGTALAQHLRENYGDAP